MNCCQRGHYAPIQLLTVGHQSEVGGVLVLHEYLLEANDALCYRSLLVRLC